jgi:hypothetical protein
MIRNSLYGALTAGILFGFGVAAIIFIGLESGGFIDPPREQIEQLCQTQEKAVVQGCEENQHALNEVLLDCEHMLNVRKAQLDYCAEIVEKLTKDQK